MSNCDFYAFAGDRVEIRDFMVSNPHWMLLELMSPDREIREFRSTRPVLDAFPLRDTAVHLRLHDDRMKAELAAAG